MFRLSTNLLPPSHPPVRTGDSYRRPLTSSEDYRRPLLNPPKHHLGLVVGLQLLINEEFNTVLSQIDAVVNSRPLCSLSSAPSDLQALTPGHFLYLPPLPLLISLMFQNICFYRWQLVQHFRDDFLETLAHRVTSHPSTALLSPELLFWFSMSRTLALRPYHSSPSWKG